MVQGKSARKLTKKRLTGVSVSKAKGGPWLHHACAHPVLTVTGQPGCTVLGDGKHPWLPHHGLACAISSLQPPHRRRSERQRNHSPWPRGTQLRRGWLWAPTGHLSPRPHLPSTRHHSREDGQALGETRAHRSPAQHTAEACPKPGLPLARAWMFRARVRAVTMHGGQRWVLSGDREDLGPSWCAVGPPVWRGAG